MLPIRRIAICLLAASLPCGCRRHTASGDATSPAPTSGSAIASLSNSKPADASNQITFTEPRTGITLTYPSTWTPRPSQDYELLLVRSDADDDTSISLDVPDLPPHPSGMIPIGMVRDGYLKDLRKQNGQLKTQTLAAPNVPNARTQLVRSTWDSKVESALVIVRDDHVYIIRARSGAADEASTRQTFDEIVRSLKWTRPARK